MRVTIKICAVCDRRRVVRFNSIIKPERREVRDHGAADADRGWRRRGLKARKKLGKLAGHGQQPTHTEFPEKFVQKEEKSKEGARGTGGNLIVAIGRSVGPHFCLGGEKTWP